MGASHRAVGGWPTVAIIGAGISGIATGVKLRQALIESFTIFDKAAGPGGTWRHNHFPGAGCDVPAHLYSFSFRRKPDWRRVYASQGEILEYLEQTVDHFGIRPHCRFNTGVSQIRWNEATHQWHLHTDNGEELAFDVVVSSVGLMDVPKIPDLPGLGEFQKPSFHTARWDDTQDLTGKRVAVVGNGSSAGQVVPAIAPLVAHLYVFQREANWVVEKKDVEFTLAQIERFRRSQFARSWERYRIFIGSDLTFSKVIPGSKKHRQATGRSLEFLRRSVTDPEIRERLTPDYPFGCKRVMIDDNYLRTFNRSNVELVPHAVTGVTSTGVLSADGAEHKVDVLVLATGFHPPSFLMTVEVFGLNGRRIHGVWEEAGGPEAFLGVTVPGFPNFFMQYGPNTNNATTSQSFMLEVQAAYIVKAICLMSRRRISALEVRRNVAHVFNRWLQRKMPEMAYMTGCHNYYRSPSGKVVTNWPHTSSLYWVLLRTTGAWWILFKRSRK
jgi:cation diffusion facilitator CzcD-associated flavoprotein CzcO